MKCGFDLDIFVCVTFTTSCDLCLLEGTQFHSFTKILVSELDLLTTFLCSVCTWRFQNQKPPVFSLQLQTQKGCSLGHFNKHKGCHPISDQTLNRVLSIYRADNFVLLVLILPRKQTDQSQYRPQLLGDPHGRDSWESLPRQTVITPSHFKTTRARFFSLKQVDAGSL